MPAHRSFSVVARGVEVERGDRRILHQVDLTVGSETRLAVVGPNGVGKTTLLEVLAGRIVPDRGTITKAPPATTIGLLHQELGADGSRTARELIAHRTGVAAAHRRFERATRALADGAAGADQAYQHALEEWLAVGAADFETRLAQVLDDLGLPESVLDLDVRSLSGGQAARVGLASVLSSRFDLTLLDEPTNNLDADGLAWLESWVTTHPGGLVIVSHDRTFLERSVSAVLEIDEHEHTAALFRGGWRSYLTERERALEQAVERHAAYVTERERLAARAQRQREWVDRGLSRAKKRPTDPDKNVRNYKVAQTERLAAKARATDRALERLEVVDKPWEGWDLRFSIGEAPRSGGVVVEFRGAVLRRGDFELGPLDLEIGWADRVVLAGPNGSGKSTMIAAVLGRLEPAQGTVRLGPAVVVGELDQQRGGFDRQGTSLVDVFSELAARTNTESRSVLAKFGLDADAVSRPVRSLSPGERTRAQLALFQARGVNFVILDEPTNHLDLPAIEQLEAALAGYGGTLLLVSHDRRLLDNVAVTHTIELPDLVSRRP